MIYSGKISGLPKLFEIDNLRLTPSLIYPKEKNWVVNTDYDLALPQSEEKRDLYQNLQKEIVTE